MPEPYIICCAAWVCCDPPAAREALVKEINSRMAANSARHDDEAGEAVADWLLENFDLVPKGVGKAIVDAYRPLFEMAKKKPTT